MTQTEKITTQSGVSLSVKKRLTDTFSEIIVSMEDHKERILHWGLRRDGDSPWVIPPESAWPEGSRAFDHGAVQTPFKENKGLREITIRLDRSLDFSLIDFALFFPQENRWDNNQGRNYRIEIPGHEKPSASVDELAKEIVAKETGKHSWTLMHRFNLCYDLLEKVRNDPDGLALIYVWMRFSAIRQLDWQRNYNTKPRELGHALDRLTLKLASRYVNEPVERELIRLIMTTLGRGSNAQQVRDEVLNIMHRHHIKEVSGHFMEEWHQKLHNNTTPDDIVICEAYLEFLGSDGNLDRFYKKLEEGGVTRERLESFERPIRSHPDFIWHLKDALIYDFRHFLGILRAVHSGTDLDTAVHAARYIFDHEMHGLMDFLRSHRDDPAVPVCVLAERITEARRRLSKQFTGDQNRVRDLLFLDLALEDFLRVVIERNLHMKLSGDQVIDLISAVLENLSLSYNDQELALCLKHWDKLRKLPRFDREWSLHAKAVADRISRGLGGFIDRHYNLLQPKAESLGRAFHAKPWTIALFTEEVLRGRPAFVLSMLLRNLETLLRERVPISSWQIISPAGVTGLVETSDELKSVQGRSFNEPVVLIAGKVAGDEEIPHGVAGIITPSVIDVLSHIAVRSRNAGVFFATCHDREIVSMLRSMRGRTLSLRVDHHGEVAFEESEEKPVVKPQGVLPVPAMPLPESTTYVIGMDDFSERNVGGKSGNLRRLKGKLPEWIHTPPSVALPFGIFERVLAEEINRETAIRCNELIKRLEAAGDQTRGELLKELRSAILALISPKDLMSSLYSEMEKAGLAGPLDREEAWTGIKSVWSSKWNERAFLSRKSLGIPHENLFMAVLIQQVVEAEYSFVIHTVNPITAERNEVYGEVVLGLGEALVGNYPGKALSFVSRKGDGVTEILSFPDKDTGLFGGGLIFRSDSNGEDLAGYAGAGLYDSFIQPSPEKVSLDYTRDPLVWDAVFRKDLTSSIARIGVTVEKLLSTPQDIEGAYSGGKYYIVQSRPQVGLG